MDLSDAGARAPRRGGLPFTVVVLGFTSLFTDVGTEMIFPLLPVFLSETLGAGPTYVGLVEGAADTVANLMKFVSGVLADFVPRRKPLVLFGYGIASAVRPFVALATRPWHVLLVRVTDRVGKGIRGSPRDALIADAAGDRAGRAFGFHQAMDNAGAVLGPLVATALLAAHAPIRAVFWVAVIPGVIATTLVAFVREEPADRAAGRARTAKDPSPAVGSGPAAPRGIGRPVVLYLVVLALFSLGNSSDAFLLLRARSLGLPTAQIPILWSVLNLSKVVWAYLGGDLADRVPRARVIASGWVVFAFVYLGLGRAWAQWHVWALFVVYGVFYGLTEPVEKALLKDLVPSAYRGRAYGAYNLVVGVTALPAGLLAGVLWRVHGPALALGTSALLAAAAAIALLIWDAWRPRPGGGGRPSSPAGASGSGRSGAVGAARAAD
ncbi:MAG: MFS transporter [Myxococcales bacterium]|nr:MFS transporter [Myxococcales bacterium]